MNGNKRDCVMSSRRRCREESIALSEANKCRWSWSMECTQPQSKHIRRHVYCLLGGWFAFAVNSAGVVMSTREHRVADSVFYCFSCFFVYFCVISSFISSLVFISSFGITDMIVTKTLTDMLPCRDMKKGGKMSGFLIHILPYIGLGNKTSLEWLSVNLNSWHGSRVSHTMN